METFTAIPTVANLHNHIKETQSKEVNVKVKSQEEFGLLAYNISAYNGSYMSQEYYRQYSKGSARMDEAKINIEVVY